LVLYGKVVDFRSKLEAKAAITESRDTCANDDQNDEDVKGPEYDGLERA